MLQNLCGGLAWHVNGAGLNFACGCTFSWQPLHAPKHSRLAFARGLLCSRSIVSGLTHPSASEGCQPNTYIFAGEMKKALRTVIERYELPVRLTANQNVILTAIDPSWKADILATLTAAGVKCASS